MINIPNLTDAAVEQAFTLAVTIVKIGTYYKNASGQADGHYDVINDVVTSPTTDIPNVRMIMASVSEEELAGTNITVSDVKILIPGKDLGSYVPGTEDSLEMAGTRYNVIQYKPLPVDSLRILFCRAQ